MSLRTLERWFMLGIVPLGTFATFAFVITTLATVSSMSLQEVIISLSQILIGMIVICVVIVVIGMIIDAMLGYNNQ